MRGTFCRYLLSAMIALQPVAGLTAQSSTSRDGDEVLATLTAMWDAVERGDSSSYATYIHPDFTQFGENDTYLTSGRNIELRSMGAYMRRAKEMHTDMHQAVVTVRGSVAWVTYYWTDAGYIDGKRSTSRGKSTRIFVKENGRWLCIHGHYTAVP